MLFNAATLFALIAAVSAQVDPAVASLQLYQALPSSLQAIAIASPAAAATIISAEFVTGIPTWFTVLPTDVQTYFLTKGADAVPTTASAVIPTGLRNSTAAAIPTGLSNSTATGSGRLSNSTITSTRAGASSSLAAASSSLSSALASASSSARSATSSGGASLPTQVVGAGLMGALGLVGMLAL
ncbi:hypothetical protein EJ08DRAFT_697275 [Tothia fuscella]|uniref:Uncharacterized protein n=1 Tax=Tothia fuscella TaxID=1048955 RepID=A0A9P4NRU1_9PEZI|nr:hypothetical protein EJ08DRAFT_697275 [Tothia fuscella]